MASLQLQRVVKRYGTTTVIHGVDLEVKDGEFVVFVGPSGCGKSTLLRMIAGLESVTDGDLLIDAKRVNDISAAQRGLAMVFQSYALYPHMTVYQNLAFGLENLGAPRAEVDAKVKAAAKLLKLEALLERRPTQLSGGQRQRVAIGRAIVRDPTIFLFDEPLSNLDAELRVQMRAEITALHKRLGTTMIYVTHDQVEAMTMAHRIAVLRSGNVEQFGTPLELYNRPVNRFVAGFIGSPQMNFLNARIVGASDAGLRVLLDAAPTGESQPPLPIDGSAKTQQRVMGPALALTATIERVEQLGAASFLYCALGGGERLTVHAPGQVAFESGTQIKVSLPVAETHVFDTGESENAFRRR